MILKWEKSVIARDEMVVFSYLRFLKALVSCKGLVLGQLGNQVPRYNGDFTSFITSMFTVSMKIV